MQRAKPIVWNPPQPMTMQGQMVAVIGGTGGIGRALSRHFADLGASVLVVGRSFRDAGEAGLEFVQADLEQMQEAARVADLLPAEHLDMLVFTTGIFAAPQRQETAEGIERDLAVSYLNRLVMLRKLVPRLGAARDAGAPAPRVFVMGYPGSGQKGDASDLNAEQSYKPMAAHMNTVAGNEMLVLDGARRYPHLRLFGLNPGLIKTSIRDNLLGQGSLKSRLLEGIIGLLTPAAQDYARRITPLLLSPDLSAHSGALFDSKARAILPSPGMSDEHIAHFLDASAGLLARTGLSL